MVRSISHFQAMWLMSAAEAKSRQFKLESWIHFLTPLNFPMLSIISSHSFQYWNQRSIIIGTLVM